MDETYITTDQERSSIGCLFNGYEPLVKIMSFIDQSAMSRLLTRG
jgi:hypothetical protein